MSGDLRRTYSSVENPQPPMEGPRTLGNGRQSPTSPLKLFGQAKKKINEIFIAIGDYINETSQFVQGGVKQQPPHDVNSMPAIVSAGQLEQVTSYLDKVRGIREMLARDRMKVVFFGRTSNGKSTVINAMLKDKILPTGIGHTTHCFLQVEGIEGKESYILIEPSNEKKSLQSISGLASALSTVKVTPETLIKICWPKEKCHLLKDDVILLDSPGIDVSPDLDNWIDNHCLDADVFVLVANAESTLMQTEKKFFHKVSTKLSKPNIFILNNRWDASASEPETMEEVKQQHCERNYSFLVDELKVMNKSEAENRVFFVSAREALISRFNQDRGTPTPSGSMLEGYQGRLFEFCNFERKFEECISKSAVQTKFAQHTANGKLITSDIRGIMEEVFNESSNARLNSEQDLQEARDKLDYTEKQLSLLTSEIKDKIRQMVDEVDKKVSLALLEEIKRLAILVDEFDRPFHPDPMFLNIYKKELHSYLENGITQNLNGRCSSFIKRVVDDTTREIVERLLLLLPQEARQQTANLLPVKDFEVVYRLDCRNLCSDFREDIEFRFRFGISALMQRFLGRKGAHQVMRAHSGYVDTVPRSLAMTPQTPSNERQFHRDMAMQDQEMLTAMITTFASLYSTSTIGTLAISGLIAKAAGWRVIALCGAIYGLLYIYERLTWTNKAKERAFKKQYVNYAGSKLKLIIDLTSSNCSHQVQQELQSTFAQLCHQVDIAKSELVEELKGLQNKISRLDDVSNKANFLKNKANYLDSELDTFIHQYLKLESHL